MGPLPNGLDKWLINGGDPNYFQHLPTTCKSWDDPVQVKVQSGGLIRPY